MSAFDFVNFFVILDNAVLLKAIALGEDKGIGSNLDIEGGDDMRDLDNYD